MLYFMQHHHILSLQGRANAKRTPLEKTADWLTKHLGSMTFLLINLIWFLFWILLNIEVFPGLVPFDPFPFSFLTLVVSLEAIGLSIIVLMSQSRAAHVADVREEMDLQMDVITEQEITKLLELTKQLAEREGLDLSNDKTLHEMLKQIDVGKIQRVLERQMD